MSMAPLVAPKLASKARAARLIGVPVKTVNALIAEGELKEVRLTASSRLTVLQSSIDDLIRRKFGVEQQQVN